MVGLSSVQRRFVLVSLGESLDVVSFIPSGDSIYIGSLTLEVDFLSKNKKTEELKVEDIVKGLMRSFSNQYFTLEQRFVMDFQGTNLEFRVKTIENVNLNSLLNNEEAVAEKGLFSTFHISNILKRIEEYSMEKLKFY